MRIIIVKNSSDNPSSREALVAAIEAEGNEAIIASDLGNSNEIIDRIAEKEGRKMFFGLSFREGYVCLEELR